MASNPFQQGVPGPPIVDKNGVPTGPWFAFFLNLWQRTGGANGSAGIILNSISSAAGATLYQNGTEWVGLNPGLQYQVYQMGVGFPGWGFLTGQSFAKQNENLIFAGPSSGGAAYPTFRSLQSSDLSSIAGQYPATATNDNATAGYIGEYIFDEVASGSAIPLSSGTSTNIAAITLSAGDWDVWGNLVSAPAGSTTQSDIRAWISETSATDPGPPNNGGYAETSDIAAGTRQVLGIPAIRISLATATIIFLSANVTFAISTLSAYGFLGARRRR
jgi:hypothetical protein